LSEEKLLETYQNAYLYMYTSPEEDFGLGPLEAGACGVPSIVWDNAGPKETVINGVTGFRAKPFSLNDLSEKQLTLLNNQELRKNMGGKAEKFVKNKFTWTKHIDLIENKFEKEILY
jgi:glycosyltransferase involved in cell wall biosynthesis